MAAGRGALVRLDYTGCLEGRVGRAGLARGEIRRDFLMGRKGYETEARRLRRELKRPRAVVAPR